MRILRTPDVATRTGLSRSTLMRLQRLGQFPRPYRLGLRAVGWNEAEVQAWLDSRRLTVASGSRRAHRAQGGTNGPEQLDLFPPDSGAME